MFKSLDHVAISVSSLEESLAFYQDTLGLMLLRRLETGTGKAAYIDIAGHGELELIQPQQPVTRGFHHFAILSDDIEHLYAELRKRSTLKFDSELGTVGGRKFFMLRDPDDVVVQVIQRE